MVVSSALSQTAYLEERNRVIEGSRSKATEQGQVRGERDRGEMERTAVGVGVVKKATVREGRREVNIRKGIRVALKTARKL